MRKLFAFNFTTLNGYYKGIDEDISWHRHGAEEAAFAAESMKSDGGILLFGRVTYEHMAGYWPTSDARRNDPDVASGMNRSEKIVFSNTLKKADWNNTTVISGDIATHVKQLKQTKGKDLTILGSGSIVSLLAGHGLIDRYQIMVDPVVLGGGTSLFDGITGKLDLKLISTRTFNSGVVLLNYEPM